jgi:hypothetical protein
MAFFRQTYKLRCKDSNGGLSEVYLFGWVKYSRKNIQINNNELRAFPSNTLYKVEGLKNASFNERSGLSGQGYRYDQTLNLTFSKMDDYFDFYDLVNTCVRALVKDRNGNFWLLGAYNGLETDQYNKQSGANKTELNGYTVSLNGSERVEAPYVSSKELIQPYTSIPILASGDVLASSGVLASSVELTF